MSKETLRKLRERDGLRDRGILLYHSKRGVEKHKERIVVEQVFDQLKDDLGIGKLPWWVRGVRKVREHTDRALFAMVAMLYCNKMRRNGLRNLKPYLS